MTTAAPATSTAVRRPASARAAGRGTSTPGGTARRHWPTSTSPSSPTGPIHEGGGRAVAFVDERADESQRQAIATLARGEADGPWAIFIATYDLDGPHPAPYEVEIADERSNYRIGSVAELQIEAITNPVTGNAVHPRLLMPEGLLTSEIGLFRSQRFRVEDGVSYDHSGRYAAVGAFANTGP